MCVCVCVCVGGGGGGGGGFGAVGTSRGRKPGSLLVLCISSCSCFRVVSTCQFTIHTVSLWADLQMSHPVNEHQFPASGCLNKRGMYRAAPAHQRELLLHGINV